MDLNSTSFTSNDFIFRIHCDDSQCPAGLLNKGCKGGILFYDCNQDLSGYRSKWLGEGKGMGLGMGLGWKWGTPNPNPTFRRIRFRVREPLTLPFYSSPKVGNIKGWGSC